MAAAHPLVTMIMLVTLIAVTWIALLCILFESVTRLIGRGLEAAGRGVRSVLSAGRPPEPATVHTEQPLPIEQVAADLRRLGRLRGGIATRSSVWFTAVHLAYDERLRMACQQLGIEHHLDDLSGVDHALEQLRVEAALTDAGLVLRAGEPYRYGQR